MRAIYRALSHPRTGPIATLVAVTLAGALAGSLVKAQREEGFLKARIAALAAHDASDLEAQLVSCRASVRRYAIEAAAPSVAAAQPRVRVTGPGERNRLAAGLVGTPPAGVDVCARMESADQAVMQALDQK
jgi:hypothetical protein